MTQFVLVRHKVGNFENWKAGFDAHNAKRVEAGMTVKHVLRNADDPSEVVVLIEAKDLDRAKAFLSSPELRGAMQKSGVTDKPDVYFLKG